MMRMGGQTQVMPDGGTNSQIAAPNFRLMNEPMTPNMMMPQDTTGGLSVQDPNQYGSIRTPIQPAPTAMQTTSMPTQVPQMNQPDVSGIGLAGSEQALQQGLQGQIGAYGTGLGQATNTMQNALGGQLGALRGGFSGAEQAINQYGAQALGAANQGFDQGRADLANTMGQVQGSIGQGIGALQAGENRALGRIDQYTGQAVNTLNPYAQTGQQALGQEAALSGAMGGAAQQQAINQFIESPGQKFLREQGEKAVVRQASALGGLRGGSTLAALQDRGIGVAAQQQQQQLENMRSLASRGQEASTNQAGFQQQARL
jgi:hypothetical protein